MFEQERVLSRLQQRVLQEPSILVCFLSGSYGRRTEDAYSDVDAALVFADDAGREAAWEKRREFVATAVPYVPVKSFDADHVRPYLHVALYSNGTKVDYRYETQASLAPNPWDREIRLLKDTTDRWGERFHAAAPQLAPPRPVLSGAALTELDRRFWVMFWDIYRQVRRGDVAKPFAVYLQLLYFSLPPLLEMLPADHPAHEGLRQLSWGAAGATAVHLRQLVDRYLAARTAVIQQHNIPFNPDLPFERNIQRLLARG